MTIFSFTPLTEYCFKVKQKSHHMRYSKFFYVFVVSLMVYGKNLTIGLKIIKNEFSMI